MRIFTYAHGRKVRPRMKAISRISLIVALGVLIPGLVLVAGTGVASASTPPGNTIATAGTLDVGDAVSGGGGPIDFWKVTLNGGDVVQFATTTPAYTTYVFSLYAPGTTDANFPQAASFSAATTNYQGVTARSVLDLQAPYNGTFILAVCENVSNNNCVNVDSGSGTNPMNPYTFSTSFSSAVPNTVAAKEMKASPAIDRAPAMGIGNFEAGGATPADFWKVHLNGGEVVQFSTTTPAYTTYVFSLYAPGTTDANFPQAASFSAATTNYYGVTAKSVVDLQAPYNGTFILAVCENVSRNDCVNVDSGSGTNPMSPYTFKTSFSSAIPNTVAARETKASPAIDSAPKMGTGNLEAGGANAIDFWKVTLNGGDVVQFSTTTPAYTTYVFSLYRGNTTDTSFPQAAALSAATTNYYGVTARSAFTLQAPYNGTFILAVCENVSNNNCVNVDSGSGTNPMDPYTFTTKQTGGHETRTSLRLSATSVIYGHEKTLKFSVAVSALYGGRPTGKVYISDGKKAVCVVKLVNARGTCSPATNTAIPVGKYSVTASYTGNLIGSRSGAVTLTVKR
jgi:hypothetical protein